MSACFNHALFYTDAGYLFSCVRINKKEKVFVYVNRRALLFYPLVQCKSLVIIVFYENYFGMKGKYHFNVRITTKEAFQFGTFSYASILFRNTGGQRDPR